MVPKHAESERRLSLKLGGARLRRALTFLLARIPRLDGVSLRSTVSRKSSAAAWLCRTGRKVTVSFTTYSVVKRDQPPIEASDATRTAKEKTESSIDRCGRTKI